MSVQAMTRVLKCSQASTSARMVLLVIANHETEGGGAFPSVDTLANECALTPRQIQYHIRSLENIHELFTVPRGGPHGTNLYRTMPLLTDEVQDPSPRTLARQIAPERKELGVTGSVLPQAPTVSNVRSTTSSNGHAGPKLRNEFEILWAVYPRKVGKRTALKAFVAARKRATFEAILTGAERYEHDPHREAAYTAHPTTWLNRDGWADDPLPSRDGGERERMLAAAERGMRQS